MSSLMVRVVSALAGLLIFLASYYFFGIQGVFGLCCLCVIAVIREYARMCFDLAFFRWIFFAVAFVIFLTSSLYTLPIEQSSALGFLVAATFLTVEIRRNLTLEKSVNLIGLSAIGIFYCAWLPYFVTQLLFIPSGLMWFILFLCIVFGGDIGAYFAGTKYGKTKLLAAVSPKKTLEGALGGLVMSAAVGIVASVIFSLSPLFVVPLAISTGALAQVGDLFESLLKRVAHVKDSGHLMPGHGGMMDRLDGVYFASPFFFYLVMYYQS